MCDARYIYLASHSLETLLRSFRHEASSASIWRVVYIPRAIWNPLRQKPISLKDSPKSSRHRRNRVYSSRDLADLFDELRSEWNLPKNLKRSKFQKLVIENRTLEEIRLTATYPFDSKRFHHGPFTNYELALSLRPDSYLSHGSAAFLHGLTDQEPEFIYVNKEQSPKNRSGPLSQAGINRAFSNKLETIHVYRDARKDTNHAPKWKGFRALGREENEGISGRNVRRHQYRANPY